MSLVLQVNGTQRYPVEGSVEVSEVANGAGTLTVTIVSMAAAYRPALNDTAVLLEDGTPISGGFIGHVSESSVAADHIAADLEIEVTAGDFNVLFNRWTVTAEISSGTVKAFLQYIITNYLTNNGVTLSGSQPDGPVLPALSYKDATLMDVVQEVMAFTSGAGEPFMIKIDESLVLSARQPSTVVAPFNIVSDASQHLYSDIHVERIREEDYANYVIVTVAPVSQPGRTESFTGDGTTGPFTLAFSVEHLIGAVTLSTGGGETINNVGDPGPKQWEYDSVTNSISRVAGATVIGTIYTLTFDGSFSARVVSDGGASLADRVERVIALETAPDGVTAQAYADAQRAQLMVDTIQVSYETLSTGLRVGQSQVLTSAARALVGLTAVITEIHATEWGYRQLRRTVSLIADTSATNLHRGWQDTYKQWFKVGGGGAASILPTSPVNVGPAGEDEDVQVNVGGFFGVVPTPNMFKVATATRVMRFGTNLDVTAANPDNIILIGDDIHVED